MTGYQLQIVIKGSKPPIWRRVIVPERISFYELHLTIQEAFGWMDYHLHEFKFADLRLRFVDSQGMSEDSDMWATGKRKKETELIDPYMKVGSKFLYTYDFGDGWDHQILVEKAVDGYEHRFPQVLKWKGDSLPEDCGGIWGYYDLLERLKHPEDEVDQELVDWAESQGMGPYDMEAVNQHMEENLVFKAKKGRSAHAEPSVDRKDVNKLIKKLRELQKQEPENLYKESTLSYIYRQYPKEDLKRIARVHGLTGYSQWKKGTLIGRLSEFVLQEPVMRRYFLCMQDDETEEFEEAILCPEEPYDSEDMFKYLYEGGYCGVTDEGFVVVPREVAWMYKKINTEKFRIQRKRNNLIWTYCHAANYLYGITPAELVLKLFNLYEDEKLSNEELFDFYHRFMGVRCDFVYQDGYFIDQSLLDYDLVQEMRRKQKEKEYFIPTREMIREFADYGLMEPERHLPPIYELLSHFSADKELEDGQMDYIFHGVAFMMHQMIRMGFGVLHLVEALDDMGFYIEDLDEEEENEFVDSVNKIMRITRMTEHLGHMPEELSPDYGKPDPDGPCPCGSGKRYRQCCGRKRNE